MFVLAMQVFDLTDNFTNYSILFHLLTDPPITKMTPLEALPLQTGTDQMQKYNRGHFYASFATGIQESCLEQKMSTHIHTKMFEEF